MNPLLSLLDTLKLPERRVVSMFIERYPVG
jgi:hypothetical protein